MDVNAQMTSLLARQPTVVVIMTKPSSLPINWSSRRLLLGQLKARYDHYATLPAGTREFQLYSLRQP